MKVGKILKLPLMGRKAIVANLHVVDDRNGSATRAVDITGRPNFETKLMAEVIRDADYKLADGRIVKATDLRNYTAAELEGKEIVAGTGHKVPVSEFFGSRKDENTRLGRWHNKLQKLYYGGVYRGSTTLDLGSGLITNVSQLALANDFNWPNPTTAINTLKICNYHATGTGTTSAAATDIGLQTADAIAAVSGAQTLLSAANLQKLQTIATLAYTGTEAVTEWGLFSDSALTSTTGTPATASSATSLTATGTPYTASSSSVQGKTQHIVQDTTASPKVWGLILSNTTSAFTVPAWYKSTDGTAGSTPGATDAFNVLPVMLDHKVFSAINVVNGDSIQFTYQLTCATGG